MARRFGAIPTDTSLPGLVGITINPSADMIWDPVGGASPPTGNIFTALINGSPTATNVPYDTDANEKGMSPNMVLHNTTLGEKVRIVSANLATNAITVEADSPDDASTWNNNDVLTTASQTNTGRTGGFSDFDVTAFITDTNTQAILIQDTLNQVVGVAAGVSAATIILHPWVAYVQAKETHNLKVQVTNMYIAGFGTVPITWSGGRAYFTMGIFFNTGNVVDGIMSFLGEF